LGEALPSTTSAGSCLPLFSRFVSTSDAGGNRAAGIYTLIETCKMNDVDPQAWLADVLARLPDHPANKVADLFPWNWKANQQRAVAA
jgi:transposase